MQVPSTSRDGSNSWIVKSRGPNRCLNESWHWPRWLSRKRWDGELYKRWEITRDNIKALRKLKRRSHRHNRVLMNYPSEEFIQIDKGSGMIFLSAVLWKGLLWSEKSRKEVTNLARHSDLAGRAADGAVSLEFFVFKAATWVSKWRGSNLLWLSMAGLYPQRKQ